MQRLLSAEHENFDERDGDRCSSNDIASSYDPREDIDEPEDNLWGCVDENDCDVRSEREGVPPTAATGASSPSTRSATGPESPEETEEEKKEAEHHESSGYWYFPEEKIWEYSPGYYEGIGWCSCKRIQDDQDAWCFQRMQDERFHRCVDCLRFIKDPQEDHRRVIGTGSRRKAPEESAPAARASKLRS